MNIYTQEGWLDIPHIAQIADRNNIAFIIIIGKRQVGKTYGVLKFMLDSDKRFILIRGMKSELEMLERNVNSPFEKIEGYQDKILFQKDSDYTATIKRLDKKEDGTEFLTSIGMGSALSCIGRIRGFNGDIYTDLVYDEFIPESHLLKVRHGDDAFNNMYTTVAGNRELEGRPPLRVWLLANTNKLDSDILEALHITDIVERMSLRDEESRMLKDRGIMILLPDSQKIIEKRKTGALYRAIGGDSKFSRMAYGNEFSYDDYTDVATRPLQEYNPIIKLDEVIIHIHKNNKTLYATGLYKAKCRHEYDSSDYSKMKILRDFPELKSAYMRGRFTFQSMTIKNSFLKYLDI